MDFTKSCDVVTSNLYLAYFVLEEIYVCFVVHAGLSYYQNSVYRNVLFLHVPKIPTRVCRSVKMAEISERSPLGARASAMLFLAVYI